MSQELYKYRFNDDVPTRELEESLLLAVLAVESLHGESRVRLDGRYCMNARNRRCVVDAGTPVGRDLNRIFAGFVSREFGRDAFKVHRITTDNECDRPIRDRTLAVDGCRQRQKKRKRDAI